MSMHAETLGAPITDLDDYVATRAHSTCQPEAEPTEVGAGDGRSSIVRRFWWLGPILAIVAVGAWMLGRSPTPLLATPTPAVSAAPDGLMGFAEMYVAAYLTGADEPTLRSFTTEPSATQVSPYDRYVARTAGVGLETIGKDYWTVTVAADVLPRIDGGYGPGSVEYFTVTVAEVGSGYLATGTPLPVPTPIATVPYGVYGELRAEADATTVAFIEEFLSAYLTGNGRIPRLVTPDSGISAVAPAPAETAAVTSVRTGDIDGVTWVTATAVATDAVGSTLPVTIAVRLVATADGVRIAEVLPGPPPLPANAG